MRARLTSWTPSSAAIRRTFLAALVMNTVIVVTGGAVRLTASGLGCPTFPRCTDESLVVTAEAGVHGFIEFGNRLLTFVLTAAVVAAVIVAWRARRRDLRVLALALLAGVLSQALLGGVTVLTGLDPLTVMAHFLVSMVLIGVAVLAWSRAVDELPVSPGTPGALRVGVVLLGLAVAATLVLGTVVTGTGPHSGDKKASDRLPFDLETVSQLHADLVFLVLGLTIGLLVAARSLAGRELLSNRLSTLLAVVLAQGAVGYAQYVTDLPVLLVGIHVLGACLVWIATLRVLVPVLRRAPAAVSGASAAGSRREPASVSAR